MEKSNINIEVELSEDKIPQNISWNASNSSAQDKQTAKAMLLSFWDGQDKSALRIDLWTKNMMVDEMIDFYFQTFMGMAESLERATHNTQLVGDTKKFAQNFINTFKKQQLETNKLQ